MSALKLHLGLPKPETLEDIRDASQIAGMRRAIERGTRNSSLIRQCLDSSRTLQLGREEFYVLLAYEALVRLEELHQAHERLKSSRQESPPYSYSYDGHP